MPPSEWLHGECSETAILRRISRNLTVIPAGDGKRDAVALLQHIRQRGLVNMLGRSNGLLVVDLPSVLTTAYGSLAVKLCALSQEHVIVEAVEVVVAGALSWRSALAVVGYRI